MDVIDAIHSRRSIRSYQSNPVDRNLIESVIWDAAQAPPPFSGQVPWTFNVIEGGERIAALGARAMDHPRAMQPNLAIRPWLDGPGFQIFWNAPVLILDSLYTQDSTTFNIFHGVPTVPMLIYQSVDLPIPQAVARAWGASLVLMALILLANVGARVILARSRAKMGR